MLNPSTADGRVDDATIRKCMLFARRWGCGSLRVVNLFAYRSTDPGALRKVLDPVGPENDAAIRWFCRGSLVVAAWGANDEAEGRAGHVLDILGESGAEVTCLKLTKDGHPWHPLYVRLNSTPIPFNPRRS